MTSSIKVVDINEDASQEPRDARDAKEEQPIIEEANEEVPEPEPTNEVVEEEHEVSGDKPEPAEAKPKPKTKPKASDIVKCDKCDKSMSYKNLRYSHNCDPKPVKKQANPKPKTKPKQAPERKASRSIRKPPPSVYYSDSSSEEEVIIRRKKKPQPQQPPSTPSNPFNDVRNEPRMLHDLTNHYQLLHQQMLQQKQERYNNLCKNIFAPRVKKR